MILTQHGMVFKIGPDRLIRPVKWEPDTNSARFLQKKEIEEKSVLTENC